MYITSLNRRYNLNEFNFHGSISDSDAVYVLELLINCSINEFEVPKETITIYDNEKSYTFEGFELNEWYEENGCVKVVYVK